MTYTSYDSCIVQVTFDYNNLKQKNVVTHNLQTATSGEK